MATEGVVQRKIWLSMSAVCRLFRLNTGRAWVSNLGPNGVQKLGDGSVLIKAARSIPLGFSLTDGSPLVGASDLHGWHSVVITPDMVGHTVAVYTAIETKASSGGKKRDDQITFNDRLTKAGGIAGFASSVESARAIVNSWHEKFKTKKTTP